MHGKEIVECPTCLAEFADEQEGDRNGRLDRLLGGANDYAMNTDNEAYRRGYRRAVTGVSR